MNHTVYKLLIVCLHGGSCKSDVNNPKIRIIKKKFFPQHRFILTHPADMTDVYHVIPAAQMKEMMGNEIYTKDTSHNLFTKYMFLIQFSS